MQEDIRALLRMVRAGLELSADPPSSDGDLGSRDWLFIIATARRHRLTSLAFEGIRRLQLASSVPPAVWESLHSAYYMNLTHNLVLIGHAEALIERAGILGIPLVPLKGAAFVRWLYPHPALRPMGDLDILVRGDDLALFVGLAEELGYEKRETTDHAVSLRHTESATYLELHTHLTDCPGYLRVDTEALWARSVTSRIWNRPARRLAPEDHLFHLTLHGGFQHGFRQPAINACDAYLLSHLPEFQWERFQNLASPPRLAPLVYGGLSLCHRVVPGEPIRRALDGLEPRVKHRHRKRGAAVRTSELLSPSFDSTTGSPWMRLLWAPGLRDIATMVWETLRVREDGNLPSPWRIRRGWDLMRRHPLFSKRRALASMRAVVKGWRVEMKRNPVSFWRTKGV